MTFIDSIFGQHMYITLMRSLLNKDYLIWLSVILSDIMYKLLSVEKQVVLYHHFMICPSTGDG